MSNIDTLTGRRPSDTYPGLLKLGRVSGEADLGKDIHLDNQMRYLQDGEGNKSPIALSATTLWLYDSEFTTPTATRQILQYEEVSGVKKLRWVGLNNIRTSDITESPGKMFWSEGQFDSSFSVKTTDNLSQGNTNKYFTNALARSALSTTANGKLTYDRSTGVFTVAAYYTGDVAESTNLYYTQARFNEAFTNKSTNDLIEGSNHLYFTTQRARSSISVTGGGSYSATTGVITIPTTSATTASIAGGLPQQIPYQSTTSATTFSNSLKWDNSTKRLLLGDIVSGSISGYGGTSTQSVFTITSGSSVYGSQLDISAGSATTQRGGDLTLSGGSSSTGTGGDVIVTAGSSSLGGGSLIVRTGSSATSEKFRILPSGAISVGSTGNATGINDQYLASSGSSTNPVWKTLPTRVAESGRSDNLAGGATGQLPYQSATNVTAFSDLYWVGGTLSIRNPNARLSGSNSLVVTTDTGATGNIAIHTGSSAQAGHVIIKTSAESAGGEIRLMTETNEVFTVTPAGTIKLSGVSGSANQVVMVDMTGKARYRSLDSSMVPENMNLYWTSGRFDSAFSLKNTDQLTEGTSNLFYTPTRFSDSFSEKSTSDLVEGTRLYWTSARFNTALAAKSTSDLVEGTRLYYTQSRFDQAFTNKSTTELSEGTNLYWTGARFNTALASKTSNDLAEGTTNLFYSPARARTAISTSGSVLTYNAATGVLGTAIDTSKVTEASNLYFTPERARASVSTTGSILSYDASTGVLGTTIDTSKVPESGSLYHTPARARAAISVTGDLSYNSTTGVMAYSRPTGVLGAVPFISVNGTSSYTTNQIAEVGSFIASDTELAFAKNQVIPQSEAINTWSRFSHAGNVQPAIPGELASWEYVVAENAFRNTTNSSSLIGLVSNTYYGDYDHEVRVYSSSGDDDTIGLVIAYVVINGKEHTLSAIRGCGGNGMPWQIRYNHYQTGARDFTGGNTAVKWSNGGYGLTTTEAGYTGSPGWSTFGSVGTKIKITRRGNVITCQTTDIGSETYVPGSLITLDLNSDVDLRKFIGKTQIGFLAHSQQFSYWKQLSFVDYSPIYDIRDGYKWSVSTSGDWTKSLLLSDSMYTQIGIGRMLYDQISKSTYYLANYGNCLKLASPSNTAAITSGLSVEVAKYEIQLAGSNRITYSLNTILGASANQYDFATTSVELRVKEIDSLKNTFDYWVPSTGVAIVGIKSTGEIIIDNTSSTSRQFMVRISARRV